MEQSNAQAGVGIPGVVQKGMAFLSLPEETRVVVVVGKHTEMVKEKAVIPCVIIIIKGRENEYIVYY